MTEPSQSQERSDDASQAEAAPPRRRLRLAAAIAGGALALVLAGVLIAPNLIDWTAYKDRIARVASEVTGREVAIDGPVSLSLLPAPALRVEDVSVANIEGGAAEAVLRLETLDLVLALAPLIKGDIEVRRLTLGRPVIALERLADGRVNWHFPGLKGDSDAPGEAVRVDRFAVRAGRLRYTDELRGRGLALEAVEAEVSAQSLAGPFDLEASAESAGVPIRLAFESRRFEPGARVPVSGELALGDAHADYSGWLRPVRGGNLPASAGDITLEGENLKAVVAAVDRIAGPADSAPALPEKSFSLEARLATGEGLEISRLRGQLGDLRFRGEGQATNGEPLTGRLSLHAEQIDLDALLEGAGSAPGPRLPGPEAFAASAPLLPEDWALEAELSAEALRYRQRVVDSLEIALRSDSGALAIERVEARLPGASRLAFTGRLAAKDGLARLTGDVSAESGNLGSVLSWLGASPPGGAGRLTSAGIEAAVTADPQRLALSDLTLTFDSTTAQGSFALAREKEAVRLDSELTIDRLDLDRYLPRPDAPAEPREPEALLAAGEDWLAGRTGLRGRLDLTAERLQLADTPLRGVSLRAALGDGLLTLEEARVADLLGGSGFLSGRVRTGEEGLSGDLLLRGNFPDPGALANWLDLPLPVRAKALAPVSLEGRLAGGRAGLELDLSSTLAGGRATLEGRIEAPAGDKPGPVDLTLELAHTSHRALAERLGLSAMSRGQALPVRLTAEIEGPLDALGVTLESEALGGRANFDGTLRPNAEPVALKGGLKLTHPELRRLVRQFAPAYAPSAGELGALSLRTQLSGSLAALRLGELDAAIGPAALTGRLTLDLAGGERRRIAADLQAGALPVSAFLAAPQTGPEAARAAPTRRWSNAPFDLSGLRDWTGELHLKADSLSFAPYSLEDVTAEAALDGERLTLSRFAGRLFGGELSLEGGLDVTGERPRLATQIRLTEASLAEALAAATGLRPGTGKLELTGSLQTRGRSQSALVSALSGKGEIVLRDGRLRGFDLPGLVDSLDKAGTRETIAARIDKALSGGTTPLDVLRTQITVEDGVVSAEPVTAALAEGQLSGRAALDLAGWTMSASANASLSAWPKAPPVAVEIGGNIAAPRVTVEAPGLARWLTRRLAAEALNRLQLPGPRGTDDSHVPEVVGPARQPAGGAPPAPPGSDEPGP